MHLLQRKIEYLRNSFFNIGYKNILNNFAKTIYKLLLKCYDTSVIKQNTKLNPTYTFFRN